MHFLTKPEVLEFVRERSCLFDEAERTNPFAGSAWTLHFLQEVADDSWAFAVPEYRTGGVMLTYGDEYRKSSVVNYYASLCSPMVSVAEDRAAEMAALVEQLVKQRPRSYVFNFHPLDADSPDTANLMRELAKQGLFARQYDCFGNWYLPCSGLSFDDYMKGRDSRLVNTYTRKRKKFDGGSLRLEIVSTPEETSRAVDAFERVYAKSWKKPEPYPNFVRNWAQICAGNGWLRLGIAWNAETPIAAQFWFTMHGRASIFKLAYDEEHAKLSAGTVLSAHLFKHALDVDHVDEIDYLTGDDAYKKSWMTHRRQRIGIIACNPWTVSGLPVCVRQLGSELKRKWRPNPSSVRPVQ